MIDADEAIRSAVEHHQAGRLDEAEQQYQIVLQAYPDNPAVLHSLALIDLQREQYDKATERFSKAIEQEPQNSQYYNNLGVAFKAVHKYDKAIEVYRQAILLKPDYADAYNNMGSALNAQCRYDDAVRNYEQAISLKPDYTQAYNNIAIALQAMGKYDAAIENSRQAILLAPNYADAYNTMASVLQKQGRCDEAIAAYNQAIRLKPDYAQAHLNLSFACLLSGKFAEGWKRYKWRFSTNISTYLLRDHPNRWNGLSIAGKKLLVVCEQGLGDSLQFVRYLPMVKALGLEVKFGVKRALYDLFLQLPGVDNLVEIPGNAAKIDFDFHVPLLDLPMIFGTTLKTIPAEVPYLFADPAKAECWKDKLNTEKFKVGIVWAGSPEHSNDYSRSCALKHFAVLTKIEGVRLYSLQKGTAAGQLDDFPEVTDLADQLEDFSDTAAVVENLDLVISVDTAVVHLAGAMGKSTWTLLPFAPDWRWMLDRDDSPWYPTMRLFRQEKCNDWQGLFARVAQQLKILIENQINSKSHVNETSLVH